MSPCIEEVIYQVTRLVCQFSCYGQIKKTNTPPPPQIFFILLLRTVEWIRKKVECEIFVFLISLSMAASHSSVKTVFYLFGQLKSKPALSGFGPCWTMSYFYPRPGAICEGSRWYFSAQLVTCALFPSQGRWPGEECVQSLRQLWPHHVLPGLSLNAQGWGLGFVATSISPPLALECWSFFFPMALKRMSAQTELGNWSSRTVWGIRWHLPWCDEGSSCHFPALLWGAVCPTNVKELSALLQWKYAVERQLEKCFSEADLGERMTHLTAFHQPWAGLGDGCLPAREESRSHDLGSVVDLFSWKNGNWSVGCHHLEKCKFLYLINTFQLISIYIVPEGPTLDPDLGRRPFANDGREEQHLHSFSATLLWKMKSVLSVPLPWFTSGGSLGESAHWKCRKAPTVNRGLYK